MDVLIRTDASVEIGSGHVMRCLTIAHEIRKRGHQVLFYMKRLPGNLIELVKGKGFPVVHEFQSVDICIIDHYGMDEEWERKIRPFVKKIVVIDDLANRRHDCNVILDQNVLPNLENRYDSLVPEGCVKLLGPKYLIMREEFIKEREQVRLRDGDVNHLLVFMGGTDPTGETLKVLAALRDSSIQRVDVVVGSGNPDREKVKAICVERGYSYHCQIDYLASLMAKADFSIGAGGSTTWERCYVGLPSSSTIVAENQILATETAAKLGAVINLGWHEQVTVDTYRKLLDSLHNREKLQQLSEKGLELTESTAGPNPWVDQILEVTM